MRIREWARSLLNLRDAAISETILDELVMQRRSFAVATSLSGGFHLQVIDYKLSIVRGLNAAVSGSSTSRLAAWNLRLNASESGQGRGPLCTG